MFTTSILYTVSVLTFTFTVSDAEETARHAYMAAIPFHGMKLNAPILTSLPMTSKTSCGLKCLETAGCRSFNYHVPSLTCELLSGYYCRDPEQDDLVTAAGYRYYDVEKDETPEEVSQAHAHAQCQSDARCSPKCEECTSISFATFQDRRLLPDDVMSARVAESTSKPMCMLLCINKPMPQCRGVNTQDSPHVCEHLTTVRSERDPSDFANDASWQYHRRMCLIY